MLYVDVDALCKLAHWNILPLLPTLTGFSWDEMTTVTSLRFRAQRCQEKPDGKGFHSTDAATTAVSFLERMTTANMPDSRLLGELSAVPQIDEGEAVLLSLTLGDPNGVFLTGDKKALRGLAQHELCARFAGRILILEQILAQCMAQQGHDWVLTNVCAYKHIDKAIAAILGSRCDASIQNMQEGIRSYLDEIILLHDPSLLRPLGNLPE